MFSVPYRCKSYWRKLLKMITSLAFWNIDFLPECIYMLLLCAQNVHCFVLHLRFFCFIWFQITKQIQAVNEVYKLHNLPEFYKVSIFYAFSTYDCAWMLLTACSQSWVLITGSTPPYISGLGIGWHQGNPKESGWRWKKKIFSWRVIAEMYFY